MNAPSLRALVAALGLFACASSARAVTITFNPATTSTWLDVTISVADGPGTTSGTYLGWGVGAGLYTSSGYISISSPNGFLYWWLADIWAPIGGPPGIGKWGGTRGRGWENWTIYDPVTLIASGPSQTRIGWNVATPTVPDAGNTLTLFGAALGAVFFVRRHRASSIDREPLARGA